MKLVELILDEVWRVGEAMPTRPRSDLFIVGEPDKPITTFGTAFLEYDSAKITGIEFEHDESDAARAVIAQCAPEMARMLWEMRADMICRWCAGEDGKHGAGCKWTAVMRKMQLRDGVVRR